MTNFNNGWNFKPEFPGFANLTFIQDTCSNLGQFAIEFRKTNCPCAHGFSENSTCNAVFQRIAQLLCIDKYGCSLGLYSSSKLYETVKAMYSLINSPKVRSDKRYFSSYISAVILRYYGNKIPIDSSGEFCYNHCSDGVKVAKNDKYRCVLPFCLRGQICHQDASSKPYLKTIFPNVTSSSGQACEDFDVVLQFDAHEKNALDFKYNCPYADKSTTVRRPGFRCPHKKTRENCKMMDET